MASLTACRISVGTRMVVADGRYSGEVAFYCAGENKAIAVKQLAEQHDYDLSSCYAYSDSTNDLPLLELVGHPCAVNPDRRLRLHAGHHGWQVRDYRTGRKAMRVGLVGAGTAGMVAAGVAVGRRRRI